MIGIMEIIVVLCVATAWLSGYLCGRDEISIVTRERDLYKDAFELEMRKRHREAMDAVDD